ncbi:MAG: hypothetical protein ABIQ74_12090 [Chitinophagales bacterium]
MLRKDKIYFEIFDAGDIVRIEPIGLLMQDSELDWDHNWIITNVTVKGGKFSGQFEAAFMTVDFEKFKQELRLLYDNLKGYAAFSGIEGQLELKIIGDGLGHFEVDVAAADQPPIGGQLKFRMAFDQTSIHELVDQLDRITKQYPISVDWNINNE